MQWKKGNTTISVSKVEGFGKNYSLWIGKSNWRGKVASFRSDICAHDFCNWLDYMLGLNLEEVELTKINKE